MTNLEFIQTIAPIVQKYAKEFKFGVPSAIIAQACLESAYGTSGKAAKNNFFGMKYRPGRVDCNDGYFKDSSTEEYSVGVYTPISTDWYAFADMDSGVKGYFQFIKNGSYASALTVSQTDHKAYLTALKACGYATSSSYVTNNEAVISKWNLTQYDNLTTEATTVKEETKVSYTFHDLCNARSISYNSAKRALSAVEYIVLHYTGNKNDTAAANCNYFATSNTREAGAHYFVDGTDVYHSISDDRTAWAVGGSKYSNCGTTGGGKFYNKCTNFNSVSIEMCSTNGAISEATIVNAVALTKKLMSDYGIDADHVIRHFDVTGKACPGWDGWGYSGGSSKWESFKSLLESASSETAKEEVTKPLYCVIGKATLKANMRFRQWPSTADSIHVWEVIPVGKVIDVIDRWVDSKTGDIWYRTYYGEHYGYVCGELVTESGIIDYVDFTTGYEGLPKLWAKDQDRVWTGLVNASDGLNVRTEPDPDEDNVITTLENGKEVAVCDGRADKYGTLWYLIKMKNCYGFISSKYVKVRE